MAFPFAPARQTRIQIKRSLARMTKMYNPYTADFRAYHGRETPERPPKPFRLPDKFWEPSPLQAQLAMERITFRDLDIIQHFLADNGRDIDIGWKAHGKHYIYR